jgi:pimeloyl-ACP methyl ester carboxylesterase
VAATHQVTASAGRRLHVVEDGDPDGFPVLVHTGTPGGAEPLYPGWVEDARARAIRLIAYDRPGYGPSTPQPGRSVADAAFDARAIADQLGLERFATWGVSGGGPHAIACAALLADRVTAAASLASPAPFDADGLDWFRGQAHDNVVEHTAAANGPAELEELLAPARRGMLAAEPHEMRAGMGALLDPRDAALFDDEVSTFLLRSSQHGLDPGLDGWVDDDLAFVNDWGFEPADARVSVLLMHGEHDRFIPVAHGHWLAGQIPTVDARISGDDAHLTLSIRRIPEVHEWLLNRSN